MGVILADFRDPGNRPNENDLFMIFAKGADNRFPTDLNTATQAVLRSVRVFFNLEIIFSTSC